MATEYKAKDELGSAIDVVVQSMYFMMARSSEPQMKNIPEPHVILSPDMNGIESLSFDRAEEAISLGEKEARQQLSELLKLTANVRGQSTQQATRPISHDAFKGVIGKIIIENDSVLNDAILENRLGIRVGDVLSLSRLQKGLNAIYSLGYFEVVDYRLDPTGDNQYTLVVSATKEPIGNNTLRGGFSLSDDFDGNATYQAGIQYSMKGLNTLGGELKSSLTIGDSQEIALDYYQPLNTSSTYFWNPSIKYGESDLYVYEEGSSARIAEARIEESEIRFEIGREISNKAEARAGLFYRYIVPEVKTGSFELPTDAYHLAGVSLQYREDTINDRSFPDEGTWLEADLDIALEALGSDSNYQRFEVEYGKARQNDSHHFITSVSAGTTFDNDTVETERFQLGGFANMSGLESGQLIGNHYAHGLAAYYYDLAGVPNIATLNAGFILELGNVWDDFSDINPTDALWSGTVFMGANTLIGPAYLGASMTEGYDTRYFLQFGRAF